MANFIKTLYIKILLILINQRIEIKKKTKNVIIFNNLWLK